MDTVIVESFLEKAMIDAMAGSAPVTWGDGACSGPGGGTGLNLDAAAPTPGTQHRPIRTATGGDMPFTRRMPGEAASSLAMRCRVLAAVETLD